MPEILATEYVAPHKDFQGNIIQDCKTLNPLSWLSLTVTASESRALFLVSAVKGNPSLKALASSFRALLPKQRTKAIATYVFCQFENFLLLPSWWEPLPKDVQERFVNAFAGRYYPRELPFASDWIMKELTVPIE